VIAVGLLAAAVVSIASPGSVATPVLSDPWLVTEVVDGDTIHVAQGPRSMAVRLIGINAPESDECWADEATAALAELVGRGPVWLTADRSDLDQYGRALRYVVNADGDDVGARLVEQGAAIATSYPPDTANDARYTLLQEAARRDGRGLWAAAACGPALSVVREPIAVDIDIHPDAAGDDNVNLNDEWVRFINAGEADLDLDHWTVADESASHRYTFGELVLAPGAEVTLFTGCGTDTASARYWCNTGSAVWNNGGDTVFLRDPAGNIVASRSY
jgi:micrococcal nuclease